MLKKCDLILPTATLDSIEGVRCSYIHTFDLVARTMDHLMAVRAHFEQDIRNRTGKMRHEIEEFIGAFTWVTYVLDLVIFASFKIIADLLITGSGLFESNFLFIMSIFNWLKRLSTRLG